jgi:hypothetical protein
MTDIYEKSFQRQHKLIRTETQDPAPVTPPKPREIEVYLKTESTIEFWHGGHVVDKRCTYNDYYGYQTSAEEASKDAQEYCERYGITNNATLEVIVRTVWHEHRRYADDKQAVSGQSSYPDSVKEEITWVSPNVDRDQLDKYLPEKKP